MNYRLGSSATKRPGVAYPSGLLLDLCAFARRLCPIAVAPRGLNSRPAQAARRLLSVPCRSPEPPPSAPRPPEPQREEQRVLRQQGWQAPQQALLRLSAVRPVLP